MIDDALYALSKGDVRYLNYLVSLTTLKQSDVAGKSVTEQVATMVDAIYQVPDSRITVSTGVDNLLVSLGKTEINATALLAATKALKPYTEDTIVKADLVAADYRENDGIAGWKASDVALIKIDQKNLPVVKLGSIDAVTQGANLMILGYPGAASSNGIVDSTTSEATLTTGKVSSKKAAEGSSKMLIETDTTLATVIAVVQCLMTTVKSLYGDLHY